MPDLARPTGGEEKPSSLSDSYIHEGWMIYYKAEDSEWWMPWDSSGYDYARIYRDLEEAVDELKVLLKSLRGAKKENFCIKGIWSEGVDGEILIPTAIHHLELEA